MPFNNEGDPKYHQRKMLYKPDDTPPEWARPLAVIALWLVIFVALATCILTALEM